MREILAPKPIEVRLEFVRQTRMMHEVQTLLIHTGANDTAPLLVLYQIRRTWDADRRGLGP